MVRDVVTGLIVKAGIAGALFVLMARMVRRAITVLIVKVENVRITFAVMDWVFGVIVVMQELLVRAGIVTMGFVAMVRRVLNVILN
jgi:hypothetical protein